METWKENVGSVLTCLLGRVVLAQFSCPCCLHQQWLRWKMTRILPIYQKDKVTRKGSNGLKPPNNYFVGCQIFTARQNFNSSWGQHMTGWLKLKNTTAEIMEAEEGVTEQHIGQIQNNCSQRRDGVGQDAGQRQTRVREPWSWVKVQSLEYTQKQTGVRSGNGKLRQRQSQVQGR